MLFNSDYSFAAGLFGDCNLDCIFGQQLLGKFGPFDETGCATVEVILISEVI